MRINKEVTMFSRVIGVTRHRRMLFVFLVAVVVLILGVAAPEGWAQDNNETIPFDRAKILIELNATAEDAGIQVLLDGEGWEKVEIFNPHERRIFQVQGQGSVGDIGVTELSFESAEPSLADLPLEDLLKMFPEGEYKFRGRTVEGDRLEGTATLTHAIPDGPSIVSPEAGAVQDPNNTVIRWDPVTDPPGIQIVGYQVIVEREDPLRVFSVDVPATITSVTVPPEFLEPGTEFKFEVLAIEAGGNQTITESVFKTQ